MKKLLKLFDEWFLKLGVAFTLVFTALYPKLPSINVSHTWVYIRLEDFVIMGLFLVWLVQLLRKKVSLPKPEGYALILYWVVGLITLIYCLLFVAPHLANFFPKIAFLQYARRIEYMILFFIAFSTIKNVKTVYFYLTTLCLTVAGIVVYGFGQKFYLLLWHALPDFFQKNPFCFPAFLTGNEEFAKGVPLCLNEASRISSTFGGHYDLAAYMVFVVPIIIALFFVVKRVYLKVVLVLLAVFALEVLNFTSSRTSFGAYVIGIVTMLILWQKKKWIVPVLAVSLVVMLLFSSSTIQRFSKTIQQVQVVSSNEQLPDDLKKIISDAKKVEDNKKPEVPPASDFTVGPAAVPSSQSAGYTTVLTDAQLARLRNEDIAISTVSGGFLIKKAYALDVSFTTRFQAEWPRNWKAFLSSPLFGTGYSSLTLATDNDYLRALGETGLAGTLAFLFIFLIFGIFMKETVKDIKDPIVKGLLFGLVGGVTGLLINAVLIDVFEASKVAEPLWILLGIGVGGASLYRTHKIDYKAILWRFFTSQPLIIIYLFLLVMVAYAGSIGNFFIGDDFTWLHWAASASTSDLFKYFVNAQDFFYRPLDKVVIYYLYQLFSFQPQGYHLFILFIHTITALGVYFLATKIMKNRFLAVLTSALFILHPAHTENIYWFSTISMNLSSMFILFVLLSYFHFREKRSIVAYVMAIVLSAFAYVSYEIAVVIPLLIIAVDIVIFRTKSVYRSWMVYLPFFVLLLGYFVLRYFAHAFSGGGDYSYNIVKILPNAAGNFLGYIGLFIGSIPFLVLYDTLLETLRTQWLLVSFICLVVGAMVVMALYKTKKHKKIIENGNLRIILFGIIFAFLSLIPFLPLGNIATRYLYLASFGLSMSLVMGVSILVSQLVQKKSLQVIVVSVLFVILAGVYMAQNAIEMQKWNQAGLVTKKTLTFFRTKYSSFQPSTSLYFVNTPVKLNGVWVLPVGLRDGLWFIYRENTPKVFHVNSVDEAKAAELSSPGDSYIFRFSNGIISEVK